MMTSVHHRGYFDRDADGRYRNNDLSALLRSGHPQSVQQAVSFMCVGSCVLPAPLPR